MPSQSLIGPCIMSGEKNSCRHIAEKLAHELGHGVKLLHVIDLDNLMYGPPTQTSQRRWNNA